MEAFSDGVLAIVITIMVLELKRPASNGLNALLEVLPMMLSYLLSFLFIAVYWINHHMVLQHIKKINVKILWFNMAWLFVMSFIPFTTEWIGAYPTSWVPVSLYFTNILLATITFYLLYYQLFCESGQKDAFKLRTQDIVSLVTYFLAAVLGGFCPIAAYIVVALVTFWWVISKKKSKNPKVEA
jgi:uncharacterized membrane protein